VKKIEKGAYLMSVGQGGNGKIDIQLHCDNIPIVVYEEGSHLLRGRR